MLRLVGICLTWMIILTQSSFAQTNVTSDAEAKALISSDYFVESSLTDRLTILDDAIASIPPGTDAGVWARLVGEKVYVLTGVGDFAYASAYLEEVEDKFFDVTKGDEDFYLRALSTGAFIYSYAGDVEKALEYIGRAQDSDAYQKNLPEQFRMTTPIASIYVNVGYAELGADLLIDFYEQNKDADVSPRLFFSLISNIAYALNQAGQYERSLEYLGLLSDLIIQYENSGEMTEVERTQLQWHLLSNVALNRIGLEKFDDLEGIAAQLEALGDHVASPLLQLRSRFVKAAALYGNGRYELAAQELETLISEAEKLNSVDLVIDYQKLNVLVLKKLGRYEDALTALEALEAARAGLDAKQGKSRMQYLNAQLNLQKKNFEIQELTRLNDVTAKLRERDQRTSIVLLVSALILAGFAVLLLLSRRKLKNLASQLAIREREAMNAAEVKTRFLASMSHEIRTPLNALLGITQILQTRNRDAENETYLSVMSDSGQTLLAIVNDVLDLSKIEAGKMTISPVRTDVGALLSRLVNAWELKAEEKGLSLQITKEADIPDVIIDPLRVRQCLSNLISNAIKFTEVGRVSVHAVYDADSECLKFVVDDTGIGIEKDRIESLFEAFEQADDSTSRRFGGTGLGLAIVRMLAEIMGGSVHLESAPGKGTKVTLTVSAQPAEKAVQKVSQTGEETPDGALKSHSLEEPLRLLVVDDHPVNRMIVRAFLSSPDVEIVEAESGAEALNILSSDSRFHGVLLDNRMPDMDGGSVLKAIRNSQEPVRNIPLIFVTADAMEGDREKYIGMGADGYVPKPVVRHDLVEELRRVIPFAR